MPIMWRLFHWQVVDQGDRQQSWCLLGSKGHWQMSQGTLVFLSTSSDRSDYVLFSNLHLFLVRSINWKKSLNISPRQYSPIMYGTRGTIEDTYTYFPYAETFLVCICSLWLAELAELFVFSWSICDLATYGPLAIRSGVTLRWGFGNAARAGL
jgi:hypothetical protein